jgi:hypothetical protein
MSRPQRIVEYDAYGRKTGQTAVARDPEHAETLLVQRLRKLVDDLQEWAVGENPEFEEALENLSKDVLADLASGRVWLAYQRFK